MYIKSNLKFLRAQTGMSYRKLSSISDVPHTVIERIEKGKTKDPSITTVLKLSKALNVSLQDFVTSDLINLHGHDVHVNKGDEKGDG